MYGGSAITQIGPTMRIPTDLDVMQAIYDTYLAAYNERSKTPRNSPYLPIDVRAVASSLNSNPDVLFGRLYYHLAPKYGTTDDSGHPIKVFQMKVGPDKVCRNMSICEVT